MATALEDHAATEPIGLTEAQRGRAAFSRLDLGGCTPGRVVYDSGNCEVTAVVSVRSLVCLLSMMGLLAAGCSELGGLEDSIVEALMVSPPADASEASNLVISCENATGWPVQWQVTWEGSGSLEPTTFTGQLEAGQSQNIAVTGPVFRFRPGGLDGSGSAAMVRARSGAVTAAYDGPALELGVDYRMGDIITCRIVETTTSRYRVMVEIIRGI